MNTESAIRHALRASAGWLAALAGLATTGCMPALRQTLEIKDQLAFRAEAMQFLKETVFSDDPFITMNAIEALQEAAPEEGTSYIAENLNTGNPGVTFAALMALGTLQRSEFIEIYRTRAEDSNPNVRIAAIYAMHRCGDQGRTGELASLLVHHPKARVRANAAMAIGRLGGRQSIQVLRAALRQETKTLVRNNLYEALAFQNAQTEIGRLILRGYSAIPNDAAEALMMLANARTDEAEDVFRNRLRRADHPEISLEAARGLGILHAAGDYALDLALAHLFFNSPKRGIPEDSPKQQITRVRALAALALEAIDRPEALGALRAAFTVKGQSDYVRVAITRAAIRIIDDSRRERPRGSRLRRQRHADEHAADPVADRAGPTAIR
ncbi:MAG: HEAT repeat domain-containing protein [Phycisphaerae bacterium]